MNTGKVLGHGDLVLSHFSLARDTPFKERIAAAVAGGFDGIGWFVGDYLRHIELGWTDSMIHEELSRSGLVLHEVDAIPLVRTDLAHVGVHMVNEFGAHHLQVQGDRPESMDETLAIVRRLADQVAVSGAWIAVEFVGDKNIATANDALKICRLAGRPNIGVQVDIWHHIRGANDWEMLMHLPLELIASVQFDDGPLEPTVSNYLEDTISFRKLPGHGEFDLRRFLDVVYPSEVALPLSIEVIADDMMALGGGESARLMGDATRRVLATR